MTSPSNPDDPGAADDAHVDQHTGSGSSLGDAAATEGAAEREFGVRGAVERGPAETSSQGDPVPDNPNISLEDREPARSTDEL